MENNCGLEKLDLFVFEKTLTELVFKNTAKSELTGLLSCVCVCVHVCTSMCVCFGKDYQKIHGSSNSDSYKNQSFEHCSSRAGERKLWRLGERKGLTAEKREVAQNSRGNKHKWQGKKRTRGNRIIHTYTFDIRVF